MSRDRIAFLVPSDPDKAMVPATNRMRWWLVLLFLFAVSVRLDRVDWDQHHFFHPDERAIGFAVERLSFSPLRLNPHFFAYGSFLLYLIKIATALLATVGKSLQGFDASIFAGRVISALCGATTAVVVALLGDRLYGRRAGLLAGLLMAATVLHVQNSHFATSDVPLTLLVLLSLYFLVRAADSGRLAHGLAAGLFAGLAIATKFSALPILLPVSIVILHRWRVEGWRPRALAHGAAILGLIIVGFCLGQPYAILDFAAFRNDILEQSRMIRHAGLLPYTNQYIGVPKFLYDLEQMVLWGMGPLLGLAALAGTIVCGVAALRKRSMEQAVLFSWVVPVFAITGSFDVKFPRYLLPIYPLLILWGAAWLERRARDTRAGRIACGLVVGTTLLWLAAFLTIYTRPHTVVTASQWFYAHVPARSRIATQDWDEGFPFPLTGDRNPERYRIAALSYYEPDSTDKIAKISSELAASDYAVFQTKRIYGAVTRAPKKFPLTNRYFERLFAGDLGYEIVKEVASRPSILGIQIPDELADESFTVYDHPKVLIFRNIQRLSARVIENRVLHGEPSRRLTRTDLLLAGPGRLPATGPQPVEQELSPAAEPEPTPGPGLSEPRGIACGPAGRVYVCDFGHSRLQEFDAGLTPLSIWGGPGSGPGEFRQPGDVSVGPDGRVYVADTWNGRIQVFDVKGQFLLEWKDDFFGPRGIAVGPGGAHVFVADTGNHRIVRFSAEGEKQLAWGGRGSKDGQFFEPVGIASDARGRLFVCDNGNGRVQIFDSDGRFRLAFPVSGWRSEVFSEPHVALDAAGTPWLTVPLEGEVRHYSAGGRLLEAIRGGQVPGADFRGPMGIALDPAGKALLVTDLAGRIVRLPLGARTESPNLTNRR